MSLIEIVCQAFTDEAAVFLMVQSNEKQSLCLPGKVTPFQQNIFVLILLFLRIFSGIEKKSLLIIFKSYLFIAKITSPPCRKYVQLQFDKKNPPESNDICLPVEVHKITCIGAALWLPKISILFSTYLLQSFYFDSQIQGLGSNIPVLKNLT